MKQRADYAGWFRHNPRENKVGSFNEIVAKWLS
jgi:hypothetical protein